MKGKHFVSVEKKNNWFTVYVNSEVINAKVPVAKFAHGSDAMAWAKPYADCLNIDMMKEIVL